MSSPRPRSASSTASCTSATSTASAYLELLLRSSVVASTAVHEFFGIAMVEAMAAGLVPLLPRALSYPELVPAEFHDAVLYDSYGDLVRRLRERAGRPRRGPRGGRRAAQVDAALRLDRARAPLRRRAGRGASAGGRPDEVPL